MPSTVRPVVVGGLLVVGVIGVGLVVSRARQGVVEAAASLRTSSAPPARAYDALFSRLLGGLYDRMAEDALARVVDLAAPDVLEVGLGPGELAVRIAGRDPRVRLVGLDLDPAMLRLARDRVTREGLGDRVELVEGRVEALPFEGASFDLVVSSFSVHHWSEPVVGMREVLRVLRPAGVALLYDLPDAWARFETHTPGLGGVARAVGVVDPVVEPFAWPGRFALVRRLTLGGDRRRPT